MTRTLVPTPLLPGLWQSATQPLFCRMHSATPISTVKIRARVNGHARCGRHCDGVDEVGAEALLPSSPSRNAEIPSAYVSRRAISGQASPMAAMVGSAWASRLVKRVSPSRSSLVRSIGATADRRSEEHTSELQSRENLVCRLLLE